jgi:hypothetical protein
MPIGSSTSTATSPAITIQPIQPIQQMQLFNR